MSARRRAGAAVATVATFALGLTLAVLVAGSASAASSKTTPKKQPTKTTKTATSPKKQTTTKSTATTATTTMPMTTTASTPGDSFFVINGTVNAASDHEIVGSSAFPNYTTGAVDNYYSMAHSHVDNSPFAEGTASPADTGPVGQTAAAGNFQQPQYADARWPGSPDKATYGSQGGPYAAANAGEYRATADASEATNGLSGPGLGGTRTLALPKGFDGRLRQALAAWKAKWLDRLTKRKPAPRVTTPVGTVPVPQVPVPKVTVPKVGVTPPAAPTVSTPVGTVTAPHVTPDTVAPAPPPVTVQTPTLPSAGAMGGSRQMASAATPADGESLLTSSTQAALVPEAGGPKTDTPRTGTTKNGKGAAAPTQSYALVTSGESSLGRVSLGGGQIVIEGIHVSASITNDGTPTYKAAVSVASASIDGVPVTIDQDGVHVAGQGQGLPYQQASDALNGALKQAGIQLFLVAPEVTTTGSCGFGAPGAGNSGGSGTGGGGTVGGTDTTTTSTDQSGGTSPCDQPGGMCDQTGTGSGSGSGGGTGIGAPPTAPPTATSTTTSTDQSTTMSPCGQSGAGCDQTGTGSGTGSGTDTGTTATTSSDQSGTATSPSWCNQLGTTTTPSSCPQTGTTPGTTTTSSDQAATTTTPTSTDQLGGGLNGGSSNSTEETVTATGLHVVFTQPVSQSGVPAQYVEHILGEVYVDSLAVPGGPLPDLGLSSLSSSSSPLASPSASSSSACGLGGRSSGTAASGGGTAAGGGTAGGSAVSSSGSPSGSAFGSSAQPAAGSAGASLPARLALALKKPLWLLVAYVLWQALVIGTGASLWHWRKGGTA